MDLKKKIGEMLDATLERAKINRAKATDGMGELAVGGAERDEDLYEAYLAGFSEREKRHKMCTYSGFLSQIKPNLRLSAPPSGEQVANEVQDPKGEV